MALALEHQVVVERPLFPQRCNQRVGLLQRDDQVVGPLQHQYRHRDLGGVRQRRPLPVQVVTVGARSHEAVVVAGLELVGAVVEGEQVGHCVEHAGPRHDVAGAERSQRREPAGRPATDDAALPVDQPTAGQIAGHCQTVGHVGDPPLPPERVTEVAAVAGGPPVVDVGDGEPAGGPELDRGRQLRPGARGRATVDPDDQRRSRVRGTSHAVELGRVHERVGHRLVGGVGRGRRRRERDVTRQRDARRVEHRRGRPQVGDLQRGRVDQQHRGRPVRPTAHHDDRRTVRHEQLDVTEVRHLIGAASGGVPDPDRVEPVLQGGQRDAAVGQEPVAAAAGDPTGLAHLAGHVDHGAELVAKPPGATAGPVPVVGEPQRGVRAEGRKACARRPAVVPAAGDAHRVDDPRRAVRHLEARRPQLGRVPRHVRMVPAQPRQPRAVG